jgi:hypothetical protein
MNRLGTERGAQTLAMLKNGHPPVTTTSGARSYDKSSQ